ncbi:hypothetical protein J1M35_04460 [Ottowia testudinis]|uniref:Mu-like prophage I protein n=2 Tax=Ottowia testudinis TaxID=2816950 RepID=A0A975CN58_9BURK|nr:hypothetical protein J1M35_04460 [Ottowia testudinis]
MAEIFAKCGIPLQSADGAGVAALSCEIAALSAQADGATVLIQATPAQDFVLSDGRDLGIPACRMNAGVAAKVISAFNAAQPLVIDYEHQTLHTQTNGKDAPAAGWIHGLKWIEGKGLYVVAELTKRARQLIRDGEYRYFSPVIQYSKHTGEVLRVLMGALTNNPAIHGMDGVKVQ